MNGTGQSLMVLGQYWMVLVSLGQFRSGKNTQSYKWVDWIGLDWIGLDWTGWILLRRLVQLEHLAVLIMAVTMTTIFYQYNLDQQP